jgi:hypothetical protein
MKTREDELEEMIDVVIKSVAEKSSGRIASFPPSLRFGATSARRICQNHSRRAPRPVAQRHGKLASYEVAG